MFFGNPAFADEEQRFSFTAELLGGYDSNVPISSDFEMENSDNTTTAETTDFSGLLLSGCFDLSYIVFSAKDWEISPNFGLALDYPPEMPEYLFMYSNLGLDLSRYFEKWMFSISPSALLVASNLDGFSAYYSTYMLPLSLFFEEGDYFSTFVSLNGGYYDSMNSKVNYLNGPTFEIFVSQLLYPTKQRSNISISLSAGKEYFEHFTNVDEMLLAIDYRRTYAKVKLGTKIYLSDPLFLKASIAAKGSVYNGEDQWDASYVTGEASEDIQNKKRQDMTTYFDGEIDYAVFDGVALKSGVSYIINSSTIGQEETDYADRNYSRLYIFGGVVYNY